MLYSLYKSSVFLKNSKIKASANAISVDDKDYLENMRQARKSIANNLGRMLYNAGME